MDLAAMLALNAAHESETSPLDADGLNKLIDEAFHVGVRSEGADGFLIAMDQAAAHTSPNFSWFKSRYPRFIYIDRIIVAPAARGRGLAAGLYEELFAAAASAGHDLVGCEVNMVPPNPGSDAFHSKLGFEEVGQASIGEGKVVRYLARRL